MNKAILGKKLGMTQVFTANGLVIPVTVIEAGPCYVAQKKTTETDGYNAVQVAFEDIRENLKNKPQLGLFKKANLTPKRYLREFRFEDVSNYEVGSEIKCDVFNEGDFVDVTGTSKGHGFSGVIKRWNHSRHRMTHGNGPVHRHPGSSGATSSMSRVIKGKKLAGQFGNDRVTIQNLEVVKVDADRNVMLIKGAVPGNKNGLVIIRNAVKHN